jgi:hypothetical protein
VNQAGDVKSVQQLLNLKLRPAPNLDEDGKIGPRTIDAIQCFQADVVHMVRPDGRIDPGGKTFTLLNSADGAREPEKFSGDAGLLPALNPNPVGLSEADYLRAAA